MDTQIATWEMNLEPTADFIMREEIATGPMEPFILDPNVINWN
jgi:hypothetical protein